MRESCAIEAKITKTRRLPFSALKPHQLEALKHAQDGVLPYKIPDVGLGQKPFDMVILAHARAYVAVMFYSHGCNTFYLIPIDKWEEAALSSIRRSITEQDAAALGHPCTFPTTSV